MVEKTEEYIDPKSITPTDFVLDYLMDDIDRIRDAITDDDEITNKETLDYLDKTLDILLEIYKDHKSLTMKVNNNIFLIQQLSLIESANKTIEEVGEVKIVNGRGDIYS